MGRVDDKPERLRLRDYRIRWWGWVPAVAMVFWFALTNQSTSWVESIVAWVLFVSIVFLPASFLIFVFVRFNIVSTITFALLPTILGTMLVVDELSERDSVEESPRVLTSDSLRAAVAARERHESVHRQLVASAEGTSYFSHEQEAVLRSLLDAQEQGHVGQTAKGVFALADVRSDVEVIPNLRTLSQHINGLVRSGGLVRVRGFTQEELFVHSDSLLQGQKFATSLASSFADSHQVYADSMRDPLVSLIAVAAIERHGSFCEEAREAALRLAESLRLCAQIHRQLASWWGYWELCDECELVHFEELITEHEVQQCNETLQQFQSEYRAAWDDLSASEARWGSWFGVNGPEATTSKLQE